MTGRIRLIVPVFRPAEEYPPQIALHAVDYFDPLRLAYRVRKACTTP